MDVPLSLVAAAVVEGTVVGDHSPHGSLRLIIVAGDLHHHVGQGAHNSDILSGVVGHTQRTVGNTAADVDDLHICVVVADIVTDLLQAAQSGEVGDGVSDSDVAFHCDTAGNAGHMLLHNTAVVVTVRESSCETFDLTVADIGQNHMDARILLCDLDQSLVKNCSHASSTPSSL